MAKPSEGKPDPEGREKAYETAAKQSARPVIRFVVLFLVLLVFISVGFSQVFTRYHDQVTWLMELTATITGATLSVFTRDVSYSGVHVGYKGFSVEIIDECTGLFEMLIYLAAVFSFATSIRKKLIGVAMGLPAIFIFNVARITVLVVVGAYSWVTFNFMHLYLWQVTLILMISTIWVAWLYLVVYREKRSVAVSG
jgi:archaeosortase B (VPXXXP-CTERM-specific)